MLKKSKFGPRAKKSGHPCCGRKKCGDKNLRSNLAESSLDGYRGRSVQKICINKVVAPTLRAFI
jgi:hypothetical protein